VSQEYPSPVRRVPRWPFVLADVVLVAMVVAVLWVSEQPVAPVLAVPAVFAVLLAALLGVAPWIIEGWTAGVRERGELQAAVDEQFEMQGRVLEAQRAHTAELKRLAAERQAAESGGRDAAGEAVERLRDDLGALEERLVGRVEDTASGTMEHLGTRLDALAKAQGALRSAVAGFRDEVTAMEARIEERLAALEVKPDPLIQQVGEGGVAAVVAEPAAAEEEGEAVPAAAAMAESAAGEDHGPAPSEDGAAEAEPKPRKRRKAGTTPVGLFDVQPNAQTGEEPVATLLPGTGQVRRGTGAEGQVQLVARVNVGMGDFAYVRGTGAGLREDRGTPLKFVEIGRWEWHAQADGPVQARLYRNDRDPAQGEPVEIAPGERVEVSPIFA